MPEIARGVIPAGKRLLPLIFLLLSAHRWRRRPTTASWTSARCRAWKAPSKIPRARNPTA